MRGDDDVVAAQQRVIRGERLGRRDVEPGTEQVPVVERAEEGVLVDQSAARGVDEHGSGLHRRELGGAEEAARLVGQRDVDGHDVGDPEERVEGVRAVDPGGHGGGGEVRVEGRDAHPEATGDAGDMPRDPAEADQAQDLAVELDALVAAVVADRGAGPERALGGLHVLGDEQHQRDGMLGGRDGRAVGRVADQDPAPGRRGDVDRVVADAGPGDDHQPGARSIAASPNGAAPTTAATAVPRPAKGSSPVAGPRIVHRAATLAATSARTGRSNQTGGSVVAVTSPPRPGRRRTAARAAR